MGQLCRCVVSIAVIFTLGLGPQALAAASTVPTSTVSGRVFDVDLTTPLAGIGIHAVIDGADEATAVVQTDRRGKFSLEGLPAGSYLLVLMDPEGQPLAAAPVSAEAGRYHTMSLALPSVAPAQTDEEEGASDSGDKKGLFAFLRTPGGAVVGVLVGALVFAAVADSLTDDDEQVEDQGPPSPAEI